MPDGKQSDRLLTVPAKFESDQTLKLLADKVKSLLKERENPIPTPRIGELVLFYERGDYTKTKPEQNAQCAIVTRIDDVGRVSLQVFPAGAQRVKHKVNVVFAPLITEEMKKTQPVYNNGAWGFRYGDKPSTRHDQRHLQDITDRVARCKSEFDSRIRALEAQAAAEEEAKAAS